MSEQISLFLLRLYPSNFRAKYGEDFLRLARDRARDERGLFLKARLWFDLAADLALALPRAHSFEATETLTAEASIRPGFAILESPMPGPGALLYGAMLSLLAFGSLMAWIGYVRNARTAALRATQPEPAACVHWPQLAREPVAEKEAASLNRQQGPAGGSSMAGVDAAPQAVEVEPVDATKAMVEAIREHRIVLFGETHADKQEYEWLCRLVKDPLFANEVDDIVVEFGNSLYQKSVDRYIAGEDIPLDQVEKAWRNVIGAVGPVSPVYERFYDAVRSSNLERRGRHPIRVVLGDPYGDWEKIKDREDLGPYLAHRDEWYAQVVKDEVLSKKHRALLIMGAGHFLRRRGPGLVESAIRAEAVQPYLIVLGTNVVGSYDNLDPRFDAWKPPVIAPLKGNWLGELPAMPVVTGGMVAPDAVKMSDVADAMLYLGSRDSLRQVSLTQAELDGTAYGEEVKRRLTIQMGRTVDAPREAESPQYRRPAQQTVSNGVHMVPPNPPKSINDPLPPRPPSQ